MAIPDSYNLTMMSNNTGIVNLAQTINTHIMHGGLGLLLLITVFIICVFIFMGTTQHAGKSFAGASFVVAILSILLRALDLVADLVMFSSFALLALIVAFLKQRD